MSVVARGGEVDGVRLLSPDTIDLIFREQINGIDLVLGVPLRFGIGYGLPQLDILPWIPDEKICFWGGWGGSMIVMDVGRRMTISYMMNKMGPGSSARTGAPRYGKAIYDAVTVTAAGQPGSLALREQGLKRQRPRQLGLRHLGRRR